MSDLPLVSCQDQRSAASAKRPAPTLRLETPRLLLRPVRSSDAQALFAFMGDPASTRLDRCDATLRECRGRVAAFEWQRRSKGYAPWAAIGKAENRLLGWGGVYVDPFDPCQEPKLGYSFHPGAWGQGFATELARVCLDWADAVLRLPKVHAFVHPENAASRRVLERTGFVPVSFLPDRNRILCSREQGRWPAA